MRKMMMMMIRKMRQASVTGQGGDGGTTPLAHLEGNHRSLHIISIFFPATNYFWCVFYHYNSLNLGDHLKSMSLQIFIETVFRSQTLLPFKESVHNKVCAHIRVGKTNSPQHWAGHIGHIGHRGQFASRQKPCPAYVSQSPAE